MKIEDFENMSDEELMNLASAPPVVEQEDASVDGSDNGKDPIDPPVADDGDDDSDTPAQGEDEGLKTEGEDDAGGAEGDDKEVESPKDEDLSDEQINNLQSPSFSEEKPAAPAAKDDKKSEDKQKDKEQAPEAPKEGEQEPEAQGIDYKAEFEKLVGAPIKANGKEITLKNTDEVLRLVQQGAGYAQKMEQLKPARKSAAMLESAGLLGDEAALSQMIDLYNGDPKALAKLVKDLNIDIYALDMEAGDTYTPNSHIQSDEAVNFQDTLKEVRALEGGKEALTLIDGMDAKSKQILWGNSEAVRQLYDYKQSGIYDRVANEVHRRRTLGMIPADTPFIIAFENVGSELAKAEAERSTTPAAEVNPNPPAPVPAKPVARTPIASGPAPRRNTAPDARAAAAASPRSGGGAAKPTIDIFSLSDEDIEKMSAPPQ